MKIEMSEIQICEIGNTFKKTKKVSYLANNTFLDFDAVILFPDFINDIHSSNIDKAYKRNDSLKEFIEHKKKPIIIFAPYDEFFVSNDNLSFSWHTLFPSNKFIIKRETGSKIEVLKNTIFTDFLGKYISYFHYTSYLQEYDGKSLLQAPLTKRTLGFYNDNVIFLPSLNESILNVEDSFLSDLLNLTTQVTKEKEIQSLPDWANNYYLQNEKKVFTESIKLSQELLRLDSELKSKQSQILSFNQQKLIFTGTGNTLEKEIKKVFENLGFEILEADPNRDDLIIKYNDRISVVEIKGVVGTSAEKYANQLEKWVSNYFDETEIRPKGILIVNTFKDKPLNERTEPSFPHQMLKYSENREHCLMTSLQLFGLYTEAMKGERKEELINSLFDTIGVYQEFEKWNEFIEI